MSDITSGSENSIMNKIKKFLSFINIFEIPFLIRDISSDVKEVKACYRESCEAIQKYKKAYIEERKKRIKDQNLFVSVLDHLDDMVWAKDINGRYIVANKAFREKFCYGMEWETLQGKNDIELALEFKKLVGEENHTFGELCANSDVVIHETKLPKKFLEYGMINGKLMKLVVNKSPVYDETGRMFATCGTGRDITEWHDAIENAVKEIIGSCSCFQREDAEKILNELNKFKFEEGDHVNRGI